MSVRETLDKLLETLPAERLHEMVDFAEFLHWREEREAWRRFGQAQLARAYRENEPEYSLADLKPVGTGRARAGWNHGRARLMAPPGLTKKTIAAGNTFNLAPGWILAAGAQKAVKYLRAARAGCPAYLASAGAGWPARWRPSPLPNNPTKPARAGQR